MRWLGPPKVMNMHVPMLLTTCMYSEAPLWCWAAAAGLLAVAAAQAARPSRCGRAVVLGVAGGRRVQLVGGEVLRLELGVVHRELLAADLHGEGLRLGAELLGGLADAIGEELADALSLADAVEQLDDGRGRCPSVSSRPSVSSLVMRPFS